MEEKNKVASPTPIIQPHTMPQQPKKRKTWLVVLVIALGILFLLISGYIVYKEFIQEPEPDNTVLILEEEEEGEEETEDLDTEEVEEQESSTVKFEGDVLSAQLPEGWSIIEYFDGDGTESLPEEMGPFSGLTAIDIVSPDSRQVFTIQAVSGIGFVGCPHYALFEDDNPAYRAEQENASDEMGEDLNIIDYTDEEYIEFDFLGVTFRRLGEKYYYDTQEGNNYFEPPCVEGLLTLEGLYFTDEDGYKYEAYFYGPTDDATLEDLKFVDDILESVELI